MQTSMEETKKYVGYYCEFCRLVIDGAPDYHLTLPGGEKVPFCKACYFGKPSGSSMPRVRCYKCEKEKGALFLRPTSGETRVQASRYTNWVCGLCCEDWVTHWSKYKLTKNEGK